jgi:DNA-binding transcriptional LysR family regulator
MEQLADIATFVKVVDLGSLTEAGAQLYAQGAKAIAALDNVQLEIARFQTEPRCACSRSSVCRSSAWMTSTPNAVARCLNCGHFSTS